jgi:hypothetical protein
VMPDGARANMPRKDARRADAHNVRKPCLLQCILRTVRAVADTITI